MNYVKTWKPGHYGGVGAACIDLWRKVDENIYEYPTNSYVKMVKIDNYLYPINMKEGREIIDKPVTEQEINLYADMDTMTEYTSF